MVFTSFRFLIFLLACVTVFYIAPVKLRGYVLLAASVVFYCIAGIRFLPFILAAVLVSYLSARYISNRLERITVLKKTQKEAADTGAVNAETLKKEQKKLEKNCRRMMALAVAALLLMLFYSKVGGYLADTFAHLRGLDPNTLTVYIIVPLGISYYTFSTIGYVLDVYRRRYPAEKNICKYALYVMYFPHILQGPIARFDRLGAQLFAEHRYDRKRVAFGAQLILWGFIQKLVIADRMGIFVSQVYDNWREMSGSLLLLATLFYSVQIYTDFAGCVNIAKGVSQIFDIKLEDNFRQPYFSTSVAEFWRRWHITLGTWFKDYVYMPLVVAPPVISFSKIIRNKFGRKAGMNTVLVIALAAVWFCTGMWHGTGLNYVLWGCWQGGIIIFSTLMDPTYKKVKKKLKINDKAVAWKRFCILRTFILTAIIPRILTRAESVTAAGAIIKRICTRFHYWDLLDGAIYKHGLDVPNFWLGVICIYVLYRISAAKEKGVQIRETIAQQNIVLRWLIYLAAYVAVLLLGIYGPGYDASSFVYMRF